VGGNLKDGTHVASVGGTWMAVVYGLAGLRDHQGRISFNPTRIAKDLRFKLTVRGCRLMVNIRDDAVSYRLEQGDHFTFWHREEQIVLKKGQSQHRDLGALPKGLTSTRPESGSRSTAATSSTCTSMR
jgi:alpha,alpha-trehalose phosphorylase